MSVYEECAEMTIKQLNEIASRIELLLCSQGKKCVEAEQMRNAACLINAMECEIICLKNERDDARKQAGSLFQALMKAIGVDDESTTDTD